MLLLHKTANGQRPTADGPVDQPNRRKQLGAVTLPQKTVQRIDGVKISLSLTGSSAEATGEAY
jgi:hypothetical protein